MELNNEPQNKQSAKYEYVRQELMLGSFILHAHSNPDIKNYISCYCDSQCKYVIMNDLKKSQAKESGEIEQRQLFEESRNNGHPDSLTKLIIRQKTTLFQYLIELYSIYMHLEITQTVVAELLIEAVFKEESQKQAFLESFSAISTAVIYQNCGPYYKFSIFSFKNYPKEIAKTEIYVKKAQQVIQNHQEGLQLIKPNLIVSENEWIVIFSWLLTNKNNFSGNYKPQYDKLIASIRANSDTLQRKISQIRKRSFTLIYDFSNFYKSFE